MARAETHLLKTPVSSFSIIALSVSRVKQTI